MAQRKAKAKAAKSKPPKPEIDWEAIEDAYCAGILSLRVIGARYGVSEAYIRKRAEAGGWQRSLADKVRRAAEVRLVRNDGAQGSTRVPEKEIVTAAAEVIVSIVREHQGMIRKARELVMKLLAELAGDEKISLPQRVGATTNLSAAMKNLVALERQAFSVDAGNSEQPGDKGAISEAVNDELERRYGRIADASGKKVPVCGAVS